MVMAFRRAGSNCVTSSYKLEGLDTEAMYTVTDIDTKEIWEIPGKILAEEGLTVTIPNQYQSKILLYAVKK
jgi:hypothetical protein